MNRILPVILEDIPSLVRGGHTKFAITEPPKTDDEERILNSLIRRSRKYNLTLVLDHTEFYQSDNELIREYLPIKFTGFSLSGISTTSSSKNEINTCSGLKMVSENIASKIISILIEKNVLLENDNGDISITNEFYEIVEENFETTKPMGQAVLLSLIQFVGEMNKKECHDYFKLVSYVYGLKESGDNNREFL